MRNIHTASCTPLLKHPKGNKPMKGANRVVNNIGNPIFDSFCVYSLKSFGEDKIKYGCVHTTKLFPIVGTIVVTSKDRNVGAFLGIVKALSVLKERKYDNPIYTESFDAMVWVSDIKRGIPKVFNEDSSILSELDWAQKWLQQNYYRNTIEFWDQKFWNRIPTGH